MYNLIWNHTNVDLNWLRDYWLTKDVEQIRMFTWGDNIFKLAHENINAFRKHRVFGNILSTYKFNDNLSLIVRSGIDNSYDFRWSRRPLGSSRYPQGMYREQSIEFREINTVWGQRESTSAKHSIHSLNLGFLFGKRDYGCL